MVVVAFCIQSCALAIFLAILIKTSTSFLIFGAFAVGVLCIAFIHFIGNQISYIQIMYCVLVDFQAHLLLRCGRCGEQHEN